MLGSFLAGYSLPGAWKNLPETMTKPGKNARSYWDCYMAWISQKVPSHRLTKRMEVDDRGQVFQSFTRHSESNEMWTSCLLLLSLSTQGLPAERASDPDDFLVDNHGVDGHHGL